MAETIDFSIAKSIETPIGRADRGFYILKPMTPIGKRLTARLKEIGKSQRKLAAELKIAQPSISYLVTGKKGKTVKETGTKHIVPIAKALGVNPEWLENGKEPKFPEGRPQALMVGKVGAGAEVTRFEEGVVLESIDAPFGFGPCNAAVIEGDSMYPQMEAGWVVFYGREHNGILDDCIGKICIVQVKDGPTLLKKLRRGTRKGLWRLESQNAPDREDVRLEWAARVHHIALK